MSACLALLVAAVLAGCGKTNYFAGRNLPPSGLTRRVLIAIQNQSTLQKGGLQIVDAFYDTRYKFNNINVTFPVSGYAGALPITIQNMPEEQTGVVYGSGDGSFDAINYGKESMGTTAKGLTGLQSSIYMSRAGTYVVAASQPTHQLTIANQSTGGSVAFSLPGVYRVTLNAGGTVALAFVQNSNYLYYARQLTAAQTVAYSGGTTTWPTAAIDCEPLNAPTWCLFQAQSPDSTDKTGNYTGAPLTFDRPVKAVFSIDGGTAYILSCGPECGGTRAAVTPLPIAPMIFQVGQQSGLLPTQAALTAATLPIPGGASNALVTGSTMYVVGQAPIQYNGTGYFTGNLTTVDLSSSTVSPAVSISDGLAGGPSRIMQADDNTLWIAMTQCNNGYRFASNNNYGCLTMYSTATGTATLLPYLGDATGIANVEGLHKIYCVEGGQVYIYSTVDGTEINNQLVTVTGTAADVAYMDATSDANNTVY